MIKRTYSYHGRVQRDNGYTPFSGCIDRESWFANPREVWNYIHTDVVKNMDCELKDVILINFNKV